MVEQRAVDGAKRACLARKLAIAGPRFPPRLHLRVLVGHQTFAELEETVMTDLLD